MAIRRLCETASGGPTFQLNGDGTQSRDFTFVSDAVDAVVRAMRADNPGTVLNIGGGHEASMLEVIDKLGKLAGEPLRIKHVGEQAGDVRRTGGDTGLARRHLGWVPQVELTEGLTAELGWVRQRHAALELAMPLAERELVVGRAS